MHTLCIHFMVHRALHLVQTNIKQAPPPGPPLVFGVPPAPAAFSVNHCLNILYAQAPPPHRIPSVCGRGPEWGLWGTTASAPSGQASAPRGLPGIPSS